MPFEMFYAIKTEDDLMKFFYEKFPDSVELIGEDTLKKTYFSSKPLPMISVKCSPYNVGGKAVIMGDAAHAMVPFYGQGMNCGFEDCIILNSFLDKYNDDFDKALKEYSEYRSPDAKAMCDLAMYNYIEMRASVNSKLFLLRKFLDNLLYAAFPNKWVPLYTMVSFSRTRYQECIKNRQWQDKVLTRSFYVGSLAFTVTFSILLHGLIFMGNSTSEIINHMRDVLDSVVEKVSFKR